MAELDLKGYSVQSVSEIHDELHNEDIVLIKLTKSRQSDYIWDSDTKIAKSDTRTSKTYKNVTMTEFDPNNYPCTDCIYDPPSSGDGKPCTMCNPANPLTNCKVTKN